MLTADSLVQKYIGLDENAGREYKLFFLTWLENTRYCSDNRIAHTHVRATQEALRVRLGGELISSAVLSYVNPVINAVLMLIRNEVAYLAKVKIPLPDLGLFWQSPRQLHVLPKVRKVKMPVLAGTAK